MSLIQKIKQFVGLSDGTGSESETSPSTPDETDVFVEREPEQTNGATETDTDSRAPAEEDDEPDTDSAESTETDVEDVTEDESATGDSVEKIKGIGPTYRDRLEAKGLGTVPELAESDAETVSDVAQTTEGRAEEWIKRAKNR